jgi:hypothetical protein
MKLYAFETDLLGWLLWILFFILFGVIIQILVGCPR